MLRVHFGGHWWAGEVTVLIGYRNPSRDVQAGRFIFTAGIASSAVTRLGSRIFNVSVSV